MLLVEGRKEMFYLTTHSSHFIYGYMASDYVSKSTVLYVFLVYKLKVDHRYVLFLFIHVTDIVII